MSEATCVGVLTGGGDCPGLNAAIRAVVRSGAVRGSFRFVGFRNGWAGLLHDEADALTLASTAGILPRGGTILGTSRTNPYAQGADGTALVRSTTTSLRDDGGHARGTAERDAAGAGAARAEAARPGVV
jgi:6-phosphofructokinase